MRLLAALVLAGVVGAWTGTARAEGRVELELLTEEGFPAFETQRWYRLFTDLKVAGLTIRAGRVTDKIEIVTEGEGDAAVHHVTAVLTSKNELLVPGGKFTLRDQGRLATWLAKIGEGGPGEEDAPRPFGLTAEELLRVRKDLARPVATATLGQDRAETLTALLKQLDFSAVIEGNLNAALGEAGPVTEELQGLSSGAAAAYLLRPAGLGLAPRQAKRGSLEYVVFTADDKRDRWPVGLPADDQRDKVLPKVMEFLNIEVEDVPLTDALTALSKRLDAPMLLDHIALATHQIEMDKVRVSLPGKRTTYSLALRKLLGQARLKSQLRIDDAGKPFFWITTYLPVE